MTLADRLTAAPAGVDAARPRGGAPKGYEPHVRYEGNVPVEVSVTLPAIPPDEQAYRDEIKRIVGVDIPDDRVPELVSTRYWGDPQNLNIYCRFDIRDRAGKSERLDLDEIIRVVKKAKPPKPPKTTAEQGLVVALADMQVGKVGSRGGTEELVARLWEKLDALERHAKQVKAESVYILDVGDCIENFESTGSQLHTNDLSLPEQLRVARRIFTEFVVRMAKIHPRVVVAGIPSNHGRWRRGKDNLGKSGDDFGIETLVAVSDAFALNPDAFGHVSFVVPDPWQESMALDIHGTILALAHGHQVTNPDRVPQWWANQVHGGQPAADADILLTGHFHCLRVQPTGRSAHTGRAKWWIQAPTLDNGSDWFRVKAGADSDPGLLTFTVDANGWDGLKVL